MDELRRARRAGLDRGHGPGRGDPRTGGDAPGCAGPAGPRERAGRSPVPEHPDATERRALPGDRRGRGANLDAIDVPLNNRAWLKQRFAEVRGLSPEAGAAGRASAALVNRTDPGPGGFYDDLGDPTEAPAPRPAARGSRDDPMLRARPGSASSRRADWPMSWCRFAERLYDAPLRMHYTDLDPEATYRVRVVYAGDRFDTRIRLMAEGVEVHPWLKKPDPVRPVEFDVPARRDRRRGARPDLDPGAGPRRERPRMPGRRGLADPGPESLIDQGASPCLNVVSDRLSLTHRAGEMWATIRRPKR